MLNTNMSIKDLKAQKMSVKGLKGIKLHKAQYNNALVAQFMSKKRCKEDKKAINKDYIKVIKSRLNAKTLEQADLNAGKYRKLAKQIKDMFSVSNLSDVLDKKHVIDSIKSKLGATSLSDVNADLDMMDKLNQLKHNQSLKDGVTSAKESLTRLKQEKQKVQQDNQQEQQINQEQPESDNSQDQENNTPEDAQKSFQDARKQEQRQEQEIQQEQERQTEKQLQSSQSDNQQLNNNASQINNNSANSDTYTPNNPNTYDATNNQ